jgi:site-specific DNA-methyltransferase (adenine-specific)
MTVEIKNGDALELIKLQKNESVDLIVTSPPYADIINYGDWIENHTGENYVNWLLSVFVEVARVLKPSGSFILNINENCEGGYRSTVIYDLISRNSRETDLKFYDSYIWHKKSCMPNSSARRFRHSTEHIFHFCKDSKKMKFFMARVLVPSVSGGKKQKIGRQKQNADGIQCNIYREITMPLMSRPENVFRFRTAGASRANTIKHPAPFHKELPAYFINLLTDENDLVIDTFSGIGTTGEACKDLSRNYIGYELNEIYAAFSRKRLNIQPANTIEKNDIRSAA